MSQRGQNNRNNNNSAYSAANQKYEARQSRGGETDIESSVPTVFREMRCFCGCTAMTYEQIEHFAMMNVSSLIVHSTGKTLFQNFLRIGHCDDKSEAMVHLECYELCEKFLRNIQMIEDNDDVEHLLSVCPTFVWEQRITNAKINNSSDQRDGIRQVLNDLKRECVHSIECHNDYDRFRRELLRKIGKS